ncbi:MAG: hypothetical protein KAY32_12975 [Candidatus Eisenbacteria sp.]|nr:hypothetical protein [Candidatus Eisenbacteria bacterium]
MAVTRKKTTRKVMTKAQRLVREKAIIRDLRSNKLSYRKIAAKHRVSLPTVNAKARKAGISRRGATKVAASARRPRATTTARVRATARRTTRTPARRTTTRRTTTKRATPRTTIRTSRSREYFNEQFRSLIMNYYPNMPLRKFERLNTLVKKAIS